MTDRGEGFFDERRMNWMRNSRVFIYGWTVEMLEMKQGLCRWDTSTRLSCAFRVKILLSLTANANLVANNFDR